MVVRHTNKLVWVCGCCSSSHVFFEPRWEWHGVRGGCLVGGRRRGDAAKEGERAAAWQKGTRRRSADADASHRSRRNGRRAWPKTSGMGSSNETPARNARPPPPGCGDEAQEEWKHTVVARRNRGRGAIPDVGGTRGRRRSGGGRRWRRGRGGVDIWVAQDGARREGDGEGRWAGASGKRRPGRAATRERLTGRGRRVTSTWRGMRRRGAVAARHREGRLIDSRRRLERGADGAEGGGRR